MQTLTIKWTRLEIESVEQFVFETGIITDNNHRHLVQLAMIVEPPVNLHAFTGITAHAQHDQVRLIRHKVVYQCSSGRAAGHFVIGLIQPAPQIQTELRGVINDVYLQTMWHELRLAPPGLQLCPGVTQGHGAVEYQPVRLRVFRVDTEITQALELE